MNVEPPASPRTPSTDSDDTNLIIAFQARDRQAFEKLYLGYHSCLTRFLGRFTMGLENIEEIILDTFMIIWGRAEDFRHESKVSTWIVGIAYRTAMRQLRRQRNVLPLESVDDLPENTNPTQDIETKDWLCCALGRLPLEQHMTLTLAYQMGYSVEEIALHS
jgi:RNA polymerase sigma-70 factor (ECF subfamily)